MSNNLDWVFAMKDERDVLRAENAELKKHIAELEGGILRVVESMESGSKWPSLEKQTQIYDALSDLLSRTKKEQKP